MTGFGETCTDGANFSSGLAVRWGVSFSGMIEIPGGSYVIGVHTEMAKEWLENRLHDIVRRALASVVGMAVQIKFKLVN